MPMVWDQHCREDTQPKGRNPLPFWLLPNRYSCRKKHPTAASQDLGFTCLQEKYHQCQNCCDTVRFFSSCLVAYHARAVCYPSWALCWEEKLENRMFAVSKTRTQPKLSLRNHVLSPGSDFLNIAAPSPEMEAQLMYVPCSTINFFKNKKYLFSIPLCCSFLWTSCFGPCQNQELALNQSWCTNPSILHSSEMLPSCSLSKA